MPSLKNGTSSALANVAASQTDSNIVTAVTNNKIRVTGFIVSCGGTASPVTFNTKPAGAGVAISATFNNSVSAPENPKGWFETNAGEGLTVTTGVGSTTGIHVKYTLVPS